MVKPISISLSPNTEPDDVLLAFKLLFQPWRWKQTWCTKFTIVKNSSQLLEKEFQEYLGVKYAFAFNSGRSAFLAILESLGLQKGDEVLIQAFTCNAVPNPVLWAGFTPVYVDCKEDYNIDPADLEKKITLRSRVVVAQHTFGLPADMDRIMEICTKRNLILLEDCAHALGATYGWTSSPQAKGKKIGTFGKASFFSFSRDKVISCVYGGMVATSDEELAGRIKGYQEKVGLPSLWWIFQQLLHPIVLNWKILPTYKLLGWGKISLMLYQQLHILSKAVHWKEKRGLQPKYFPKALPNALAILARKQFQKLERFNAHRKEIAVLYSQELSSTNYKLQTTSPEKEHIFLRFPMQHPNAHEIIKKAWRKNLLLGDWYTTPIAPHDTDMEKMGYHGGSCPTAEHLAKVTLNLPTHIRVSKKEAGIIIAFVTSV